MITVEVAQAHRIDLLGLPKPVAGLYHYRQQGETRSLCGKAMHQLAGQWRPIRENMEILIPAPPGCCSVCWHSLQLLLVS